jgi:hypothetical protein
MLVYDDKLDIAERLPQWTVMPSNQLMKIFIQKSKYLFQETSMKSSWISKTALEYTDDYADVYNLIGMNIYLWII